MQGLDIKKLLQVVFALRTAKHTGILTVVGPRQKALLYFKQGQLVDAQARPSENTGGEDVLYRLLNWQSGHLEWQPGPPPETQSLDSQQEADFYQAAEDIVSLGYFDKPLPVIPAEVMSFIAGETLAPATAPKVVASTKIVEVSTQIGLAQFPLPLLPGQPFALASRAANVAGLVDELRRVAFTGYATLGSPAGGCGLLVCENGEPTAVYVCQGGAEAYAAPAWRLLTQWSGLNDYTLTAADPQLLAAWRSLLGPHRPYKDLAATFANFRGLLATFERGNHSGIILIHLEQVRLFQLIYKGKELGTYGSEGGSNQLRALSSGLSLLLENPQARLDVMVSRHDVLEESAIFRPGEITTLAGTLSAVVGLAGTLIPPATALTRFSETIDNLKGNYPFVEGLTKVELATDNETRATNLSRWLGTLHGLPRRQVLAAFEELFEEYLQPTCLKIGPQIFHELVVRALGPVHAANLQKMDLRVDFFDKLPVASSPLASFTPTPVAPDSFAVAAAQENPYDF